MDAPAKHHLRLTPPSLADNTATIDRLAKALRPLVGARPLAPVGRLWEYAKTIRAAGHDVTATVAPSPAGPVIAAVEPGDATNSPPPQGWEQAAARVPPGLWGRQGLGVAIDLGSTHLQASLHSLESGAVLAGATAINPQTEVGSDVLTRIHYAADPENLAWLQRRTAECMQDLIARMCAQAGRDPAEVTGLVAAGNTTMTHLFLGLDVQSICREPYIPVVNRPAPFFAADLGLTLAPEAVGWCLPNVGSYFGGDLVAGIVAAGLHLRKDVALLVDVGTNAEVVVGNREWLLACAGAAGPALEGGVARTGVLAQPGAVQGVRLDPDTLEPTLDVIPETDGTVPKIKGLCGSGLLQLLAQLFLTGAIDRRGRFAIAGHPRLVQGDEAPAFVVATAEESASGQPVMVDEIEIDVLLRSKAAMYTILRTLLMEVGLEFEDLSAFYVAGAFGNVIDPETAVTLGMLPDLPRERFVPLGNSCLSGCQRLLTEPDTRPQVEAVSERLTYLELNVNQALMYRFSAARFIPHTDASRFPSVPAPRKRA